MKNYSDYVDYFENLVKQFTGIEHDPENGKQAFFRINLEELANGSNTTIDADGYFFVLTNYIWKPVQKKDGSYMKEGEGMFFIMGTVNQGDYNNQTKVLADCETIASKFINRIHLDSRRENLNEDSFWNGIQETLAFENVMPLQSPTNTNHYGCQVVFKFATQWNECVEIDDWADKETEDDVNPHV